MEWLETKIRRWEGGGEDRRVETASRVVLLHGDGMLPSGHIPQVSDENGVDMAMERLAKYEETA